MKHMLIRSLFASGIIFLAAIFIFPACERKVTGPEVEEKNVVTFRGRAFLAGQPAPVNRLHLPLHYDIEIISFLPGDAASYDTVYTDSSGVYTSTKLRKDDRYKIVSRYPYYSNDTVHVEIRNGQVLGEIPRLFSQRIERIQIFADSSVYHSLQSRMFFTQYIANLSPTDTTVIPQDLKQILIPKNNVDLRLFASDPNITLGREFYPLEIEIRFRARILLNFGNDAGTVSPTSGSYYLYAVGQSWPRFGTSNPHYQRSIHWWFKVAEPSEITVDLQQSTNN